jgi:hypothetical protein|tara:strand:+ start:133 stop:324 length:192 start_codon:yes stop_codon:yes gene_type:complete
MRYVRIGGFTMKEYVSEEEWDCVDDYFREEYKKAHPIKYWVEEIRFFIERITRKIWRKNDIPF